MSGEDVLKDTLRRGGCFQAGDQSIWPNEAHTDRKILRSSTRVCHVQVHEAAQKVCGGLCAVCLYILQGRMCHAEGSCMLQGECWISAGPWLLRPRDPRLLELHPRQR